MLEKLDFRGIIEEKPRNARNSNLLVIETQEGRRITYIRHSRATSSLTTPSSKISSYSNLCYLLKLYLSLSNTKNPIFILY